MQHDSSHYGSGLEVVPSTAPECVPNGPEHAPESLHNGPPPLQYVVDDSKNDAARYLVPKLPWWRRKVVVVALSVLLVILLSAGLGVGLGVGLTKNKTQGTTE
jgi:hypothetical protein